MSEQPNPNQTNRDASDNQDEQRTRDSSDHDKHTAEGFYATDCEQCATDQSRLFVAQDPF